MGEGTFLILLFQTLRGMRTWRMSAVCAMTVPRSCFAAVRRLPAFREADAMRLSMATSDGGSNCSCDRSEKDDVAKLRSGARVGVMLSRYRIVMFGGIVASVACQK